jgi:hypothetical protein
VVASASASAHTFVVCTEGGTEKYETNLCAKKKETGKFSFLPVEGTKTYTVEGKSSGVIKLENNWGGLNEGTRTGLECKKSKFSGKIEKEGKSKEDVFTFQECALYLVSGHRRIQPLCEVPNIITAKLKSALITGTGSGPEDQLEPEVGGNIFTIEIRGCLAFEGQYELSGKQTCSLPEATVGLVEHEIVCSPPGSSLTFGYSPGTASAKLFMDTTVKLNGTAAWGAE